MCVWGVRPIKAGCYDTASVSALCILRFSFLSEMFTMEGEAVLSLEIEFYTLGTHAVFFRPFGGMRL